MPNSHITARNQILLRCTITCTQFVLPLLGRTDSLFCHAIHDLPPELFKDGFIICNPILRSFFLSNVGRIPPSAMFHDITLQRFNKQIYTDGKNDHFQLSANKPATNIRQPCTSSPPFGTINFFIHNQGFWAHISLSFCLPTPKIIFP